ncbi:NAD(+) diphosphatase [Celeribacter litoreus]|uniref:NAD(+) diphosphatase n=1 Tax=Celeribacter litoreus TaxID=2876714 RepID=UPI001CCB9BC9|nr:NAD(+) diphosphatase [Celeribacter litoreus]MCA0044388.1 NAD(+) diphosphatase [Celeribacter litoreus]
MKNEAVALGAGTLNRAAHLRTKTETLAADTSARWLPLWRGRVPVSEHGDLQFGSAPPEIADDSIFLGLLPDGAPVLAHDVSALEPLGDEAEALSSWSTAAVHCDGLPDHAFHDLRAVMTTLSPLEAEIAATARGLLEWHRNHGFCARCGAQSQMSEGGWRRDCGACGGQHFPRTDPVVIMLVTHGNDVLVGRNAEWPTGFFSILAGFVEPGEPLEAAVRREVFEEAGVRVGEVEYVASQPWPFPASLMLGFRAKALTREIIIDPTEIEEARWVSREEMMQIFAGEHPEVSAPRKGALAHFLMRKWLEDHRA